ncbi:peptidyl-alpha-hydroxyglycine alpha-amidating lyase 1 [Culex quinquefasciatus]|uniref:Peptidyl-alpha-hydroxyglycine alpha-amidating lyase 1 n=1 Tax=Culex quinquefasciatus TaxID=7176 RepID=B0XA12_CULQU|nr:peptidyl-alpha-hydroxyglycine alpha-amidating lyase 1 [Culex quinquefasciatus]|eukprot:XP_001866484.1 peptidyl-alpha-hydroxyglycine alpha-amidating lyase 1 [Culex quinquefasciatus]
MTITSTFESRLRAILKNGDFFVADRYGNGRINKYSVDGRLILKCGQNSFVLPRTFMLPAGPTPVNFNSARPHVRRRNESHLCHRLCTRSHSMYERQFNTSEPVNGLVVSITSKQIVGRCLWDHALSNPYGLAVSDDSGQVNVAELNLHKVRKSMRKSVLSESPTQILDPAESNVESFLPSDQPVLSVSV